MIFKVLNFHLILSYMIIRSSLCLKKNYINIFTANESIDDYINRMKKLNLPFLGQSYEDYVKNTDNESSISLDEYKILINSIPRLYETIDSVNERNSRIEGLQKYTQEIFKKLIAHYPLLHENYQTYLKRMDNNGILDPMPKSMFIALKIVCPRRGETFDEYMKISNELNFRPFELPEYESFINLIPNTEETLNNYLSRCQYEELKLINDPTLPSSRWRIMDKDDYSGLYPLNTKIGEYYEEYTLRIKEMDIIPMTKENFILFQSVYPNFDDTNYNKYCEKIEKSFDMQLIGDLYIDIRNEMEYNLKKNKIPYLFESLHMYIERMKKNDNYVDFHDYYCGRRLNPYLGEYLVEYTKRLENTHVRLISEHMFATYQNIYASIDEDFPQYLNKRMNFILNTNLKLDMYDINAHAIMINFIPNIFESKLSYLERMDDYSLTEEVYYKAKRVLPKLLETYLEFGHRQENLYIENQLSVKSFTTFKQNYPQIGYSYINLCDADCRPYYNKPGDLGERFIRLNEIEFEKLKKKLPLPLENYSYYETRMQNASEYPLDEIDFDDFKKVAILQSESYSDYTNRMALLGIKPMSQDNAKRYKKIIPREVLDYDYNNYKNKNEKSKELGLDIFDQILYLRFQLIHPFALENYNTYVKRVKNHLFNRDFSAFYLENEELLKITRTPIDDDNIMLKINLEPLKEYEFLDLKKRLPYLRETNKNYLDRLNSCYLNAIIHKETFEIYKSAVIQVDDTYDNYKERIDKISQSDIQRLRIKILDEESFNFHLSIRPYVYENNYSSYTKNLNSLNILDEFEYDNIKSIYPSFYQTKTKYKELMEERQLEPVREVFFDGIKEGIPKLLENHETYNIRIKSENKKQLTHNIYILKECSIKRFNKMKSIFVPRLGQTLEKYVELVSKSKKNLIDYPEINEIKLYFFNVIKLYPKFNEYIFLYERQTEGTYTPWLKMKDDEAKIFFKIFPRQFENFVEYQKRIENHKIIITEDDFKYYQNMFPLLPETYQDYTIRMDSYGRTPESNDIYQYLKSFSPQLDEDFTQYTNRVNSLSDPNASKSNMGKKDRFLKNILPTDSNISKSIIKKNEYFFKNLLEPQMMNKHEFHTFKERLPLPNEDYLVYSNRIKNKNIEGLSLKLINEINEIYPTKGMSEGSYKKAMKKIGVQPILKYKEFQKFLTSQSIDPSITFPLDLVPVN